MIARRRRDSRSSRAASRPSCCTPSSTADRGPSRSDTSMSPAPSSRPGRMCECRSITARESSRERRGAGGPSRDTATIPRMKNDSPLAVIWRQEVDRHRRVPRVRRHGRGRVEDAAEGLRDPVDAARRAAADRASFDSVQASQAIARSYADIIDSPNIAQLVADRMPERRPGRHPRRVDVRAGRADAAPAHQRRGPEPRARAGRSRTRGPTWSSEYARDAAAVDHRREHHAGRPRAAADCARPAQADALHAGRRASSAWRSASRSRSCATGSTTGCAPPRTSRRGSTSPCSRASCAAAAPTPPSPRSARHSGSCAPTSSSPARGGQRALDRRHQRPARARARRPRVAQLAIAFAEVGHARRSSSRPTSAAPRSSAS